MCSEHVSLYAMPMALYTSKLLLQGLESKDYSFSEKVFNHYIDNLYPYCGSCGYKTNVIGNALVLAVVANKTNVSDTVFSVLLGENFDIETVEHELILYNLACFYASNNEKKKMLQAIKQSLLHCKTADQFMADSDFKAYLDDADFIATLNAKIVS